MPFSPPSSATSSQPSTSHCSSNRLTASTLSCPTPPAPPPPSPSPTHPGAACAYTCTSGIRAGVDGGAFIPTSAQANSTLTIRGLLSVEGKPILRKQRAKMPPDQFLPCRLLGLCGRWACLSAGRAFFRGGPGRHGHSSSWPRCRPLLCSASVFRCARCGASCLPSQNTMTMKPALARAIMLPLVSMCATCTRRHKRHRVTDGTTTATPARNATGIARHGPVSGSALPSPASPAAVKRSYNSRAVTILTPAYSFTAKTRLSPVTK
jgi:hypothetical protein